MLTPRTTLVQSALPRTGPLSRPLPRTALLAFAGTLLLTLCAQVSFPLPTTPVPVTLQTFGVLLIGALFGPRLGAATMLLYLAEGLSGLPVFSFGRSAWSPSTVPGIPLILGPTAGYLFSFPIAAALVGWLATRGWDRRVATAVPAMIAGNLVILVFGFAWLAAATALVTGSASVAALVGAAVLPFLLGDAVKILLAALALPVGWALLHRS